MSTYRREVQKCLEGVSARNPHEPEFLQAVREFVEVIVPFVVDNPSYGKYNLLHRMTEPERIVIFQVPWQDDKGVVHVNRGFRVQMNSALGPYKGGLRFHPSVNLSILKFLAFEQTFKNSLTTLPLGSGKGGADFDPKGKSDAEVMRFCQSFMTELARHIGQFTDVPAGDIGVGTREVGYLFGQFKRVTNTFTGVLTGKGISWGGSLIRPEATGYGCVYFSREMMRYQGDRLERRVAAVSGSGNVAQFTAEKLIELGAKVVTLSDSNGYIYDKEGIDKDKLAFIQELKNVRRGRISEYAKEFKVEYRERKRPWEVPCDLAYACATQNELDEKDAKLLISHGCKGVFEGANMPTTPEAIALLKSNRVLFSPGKASNAGGVATSGLEMSQNSQRISWTRKEVNEYLENIMRNIHENCVQNGKSKEGYVDYVQGASIGGFKKVAKAMLEQGLV